MNASAYAKTFEAITKAFGPATYEDRIVAMSREYSKRGCRHRIIWLETGDEYSVTDGELRLIVQYGDTPADLDLEPLSEEDESEEVGPSEAELMRDYRSRAI